MHTLETGNLLQAHPAPLSRPAPARPRPLTFDERHAAEAAFLGQPFNARWSHSAQEIYFRMITTLAGRGQ